MLFYGFHAFTNAISSIFPYNIDRIEERMMNMERKKADYSLGVYARKLLLIVLPMKIFLLLVLIAYIAPLEGMEFFRREVLIMMMFDAIGRGLIFMFGGAVLLDYLEKKHRKKD